MLPFVLMGFCWHLLTVAARCDAAMSAAYCKVWVTAGCGCPHLGAVDDLLVPKVRNLLSVV